MSRSATEQRRERIAKRYFEWKAKDGTLSYYDREAGQNVEVGLPMSFMVLDELATVKGWHDEHHSSIWANEVRNTRLEPLNLFTSKGKLGSGIYNEIKTKYPIRYHKSIYIAFYEDDQMVIGNLSLKGAAAQAWGDFTSANPIYKGAVRMGSPKKGKKGSVVYYIPTFTFHPEISDESEEAALALDRKLQEYLNQYFERQNETQVEGQLVSEEELEFTGKKVSAMDDDDIPF